MNTKNLKSYAPKARRQFIDAVTKRAAYFGIYEDGILPVTFEGSVAIIDGKPFPKKIGKQRQLLEKKIAETGFAQFVSEIAYTWFNRLAAIRYMELHDYLDHGFRVLSHPTNADGLPEVLDHAADVAGNLNLDKAHIIELQLAGDKQEELYRELLLGQCHYLHSIMPFLFEALDDATELLLPDNLTKTDSILKGLISDIPEEDWQQIEVIGWLYQFYISEHKDAVIGKVVKSEDIPAATQLFTPNWIVKYLVQNSIGRQWLATYPNSSIKEKMEYYIEPAEQTDEVKAQLAEITPSSIDPESIKALDPACGSGHILVEIYELLREIYLERGYRLREIPELILTKNIYGLDIDDRAAQLAGFALMMKAREDDRRIFQRVQDRSVKLNVYALQSTDGWDSASLWQALNLDGKAKQGSSGDLFVETKKFDAPTGEYAEYFDLLKYLIVSFEQAKTLGSLIQIDLRYLPRLEQLKAKLLDKVQDTDPAAIAAASQLLPIVEQAILLTQKYNTVISNPPYMGLKGMNGALKKYLNDAFVRGKSDLMTAFMEKSYQLTLENGHWAMINLPSWMFLKSFEDLRKLLIKNTKLESLLDLGRGIFGSDFGSTAFVFQNIRLSSGSLDFTSVFRRLFEKKSLVRSQAEIQDLFHADNVLFLNKITNFLSIDGYPFAYSFPESFFNAIRRAVPIKSLAECKQGMATADNEKFVRCWHEVSLSKIGFGFSSRDESKMSGKKWFPYNKGGAYRKWYGNQELVVNWENDGKELLDNRPKTVIRSPQFYFKDCLSWSKVTIGKFSMRYYPKGFLFDVAGCSAFFGSENELLNSCAVFNSPVMTDYYADLMPTVNFEVGQISNFPIVENFEMSQFVKELIDIHKYDWNLFETSWDFKSSPLITDCSSNKLAVTFEIVTRNHEGIVRKAIELEKIVNQTSLEAYNLELSNGSSVELKDITLSVNPYNRFNSDLSKQELSHKQFSSLSEELLSFFTGCLMGRYSLDREGLAYAHSSNDGFKKLVTEGAYRTFPADEDGIIPLASEEWLFEDDATARFREFVKTVWGTEHLQENLTFVAESLCLDAIKPKKGEGAMETIRRYFSEKFFAEHCKMYKKRPIYWLFSSGKEKAFECLVYLHRYNESTLSRMRTEYVTPLMGKYESQYGLIADRVSEASGTEQRKVEKELKSLEKKQAELRKFDEELKHYAEKRISLDLDDGVKVNYGKFGNLLANVKDIHGKKPD